MKVGDEVFLKNNALSDETKVWNVFAIEGPYVVLRHGTTQYLHGVKLEEVRKVVSTRARHER